MCFSFKFPGYGYIRRKTQIIYVGSLKYSQVVVSNNLESLIPDIGSVIQIENREPYVKPRAKIVSGRYIHAVIRRKPVGMTISTNEISRTQINLSGGGFPGGGGLGGGFNNTPIELSWSNPDNVYHFIALENTETEPVQIIIPPSGSEFPTIRFRISNEPVLGTHSNIQPQSLEYFGNYDVILYRINPDYSALYQSSGTTTQNLSTPPSSITNGLGVFTGINADTLKLLVKKN